MDDGFDLRLPEFAGAIMGRYTIDCAKATQVVASNGNTNKEALIAALAAGDHACHVQPGLSFDRPVVLDTIANYRARWNQTVREGRALHEAFNVSEIEEIERALSLALGPDGNAFHGTSTASILARANPEVRLVVVQLSLAPAGATRDSFTCPTQGTVDAIVALLRDNDVRRAYVERPRADIEDELDDLVRAYRVGIWNKSYGKPSRQATEAALFEAGCGRIDLSQYLAVKGELDGAHEARWPARDYLEIQAAGNDGARVEGPQDQDGCNGTRTTSLVVGSYGADFEPAPFSNQGGCVDVLAPGENILASLPDGWLMPLTGTSYSTPLVAGWVSTWKGSPFVPTGARSAVMALRDGVSRVPAGQFPKELMYSPQPSAFSRSAVLRRFSGAPRMGLAARPSHDLHWRQILWPLLLL